jgi:hypothetical protein
MQEVRVTHLADDRTDPVSMWQALATSAGQTWLVPLIAGTCWWNALLDWWLPIRSQRCRHRDPGNARSLEIGTSA